MNQLPFYELPEGGPEKAYLLERRQALGGFNPQRHGMDAPLPMPGDDFFEAFLAGTSGREVSTTMAFVRVLTKLLKDPELGNLVVPIVPDEARTFGMDALFRQCGIYSHPGQLYEPVDSDNLLYYKEATDGQILEEGITEAGSLSSFIAAGTAYSNHGINTIPFFIFYSMFGFQRVADLIWAAADSRCKGFLLGATSGRTTLAGEGLQHQDGNSHLWALPVPNLMAYDPAYAYELAVIIQDGLKRMYADGEDVFYYVTVMNENYAQPAMPEGAREGILKGMYKLQSIEADAGAPRVRLLGSGTILNEVLKAGEMLASSYGVSVDVYSVTSYKTLYVDAQETERWNMLHPELPERSAYIAECLGDGDAPVIAASDYVKALCESASRWIPGRVTSLGTDGFGRSDGRPALRDFFEVDANHVTLAALSALVREGAIESSVAVAARDAFGIDPEKQNPMNL